MRGLIEILKGFLTLGACVVLGYATLFLIWY